MKVLARVRRREGRATTLTSPQETLASTSLSGRRRWGRGEEWRSRSVSREPPAQESRVRRREGRGCRRRWSCLA